MSERATELVALWLCNDFELYTATSELGVDELEQFVRDVVEPARCGLAGDLLGAALGAVDWTAVWRRRHGE